MSMRKRLIRVILLTVAVICPCGALYILWNKGFFSRSPGAAIEDTLARANSGDYAGAIGNLTSTSQECWEEAELRKAMLDAITRNGTIQHVKITSVFEISRSIASVAFKVTYKDGESREVHDYCFLEYGSWKPNLKPTVEKIAPDFNIWSAEDPRIAPLAVAASKAGLQEAYVKVPQSKVSIRLPGACQWEAEFNYYVDKELHFVVDVGERSNEGLESRVKRARAAWKESHRKLSTEREVMVGGRNAKFFVGQATDRIGDTWHVMILVFGTPNQSVLIEGRAPRVERLAKILEESLMTAKWEP
jgi:hypothetical protein